MENTNQKNTGNIQIAPVSAASDLNHKNEKVTVTWVRIFHGSCHAFRHALQGSQFTGRRLVLSAMI